MKFLIVFAVVVAAAVAAPGASPDDRSADTVNQYNDNIGVGPFKTGFETSNGIRQTAEGDLKNVGTENEAQEVRGSYSYPGTDGQQHTITYIANEYGYQAQGDDIPQPI